MIAVNGEIWIGADRVDAAMLGRSPKRDLVRFVLRPRGPWAITVCHGVAATLYRAWRPVAERRETGHYREIGGQLYKELGSALKTREEFQRAYEAIYETFPEVRGNSMEEDGRILTVEA